MQAWLDVTAGVAGDMLMGALVDAGADLDAVQAAVRAVAGPRIRLRCERVLRAGLPAMKIHVDVAADRHAHQTWPQLCDQVRRAVLPRPTKDRALQVLQLWGESCARAYRIEPEAISLQEVAALDVLTDVVGDCEALRLLGVESVTASPLAVGSGRIRTSRGDLPVPVPAVAELVRGWPVVNPAEPDAPTTDLLPAADQPPRPADRDDAHLPLGAVSDDAGMLTEEPAPVVDGRGLGELATPTGTALLRCFAEACATRPPMALLRVGVGAGGRDVPGRPNVVRVLLG
ncbi:MAG: DUF111 family protein [Micropruina sp.]|uniref:nickel insertion protein n=1 Tax=Micropruina sp. TaxID=2737536 RepID=UPI0039E6A200